MQTSLDINEIIESFSITHVELTKPCKDEFVQLAAIRTFAKNEIIIAEGQLARKVYIVIRGCARAYYLKDGRDITDWLAFENDLITSISSFFSDMPSDHFIEALEDVALLEIAKSDLDLLCDKHPCFERLMRKGITDTFLKLQQKTVGIQFEPAKQRYQNLVEHRPDINQRVPLTHIASFLGITLETLSRIRSSKY
jgi:CRP-like cAMP-binding protein